MFSEDTVKKTAEAVAKWQKELDEVYKGKLKFSSPEYTSESGIKLKYVYTPLDVEDSAVEMPGAYPYTRGLRALGYQYMPWMIQILHGYGTSEETKERTDYLLKEGMKGFREQPVVLVDVDPATHCGFEPDDPCVRGTVGLGGVTLHTLDDFASLLRGHELTQTRVAIGSRFTCLPVLALYIAYAESLGYKPEQLNGQSQNGARTRWLTTDIGAPQPSVQRKLQIELIKYTTLHMPKWNHTNLCGYVLGELGATPAQELGIAFSEAIDLIQGGIEAGLKPDDFVQRFSSQVHMGMDFFEEIAKLRVWRRLWAKTMKERFGCTDPRSLQYRIHVHTGGVTLTSEQPLNNITRTTLQVLAAVLGGVQSLHTCSYDEAIGLPSDEAVRTAIRVNQVIQHETKIPYVTDPLGGSYYIEWLTNALEKEALRVLKEIEERGGYHRCIENGWLRGMLEQQSLKWRSDVDSGERVVVGVNRFRSEQSVEVPPFTYDIEEVGKKTVERITRWKRERDNQKATQALQKVKEAMMQYDSLSKTGILMPALIDAARAKCTLAEMMGAMVEVTGGRAYLGSYNR